MGKLLHLEWIGQLEEAFAVQVTVFIAN